MNQYLILRRSFNDTDYKYKQYVVSTEKNIYRDRVETFGYSLTERTIKPVLLYPTTFIRIPCINVSVEEFTALRTLRRINKNIGPTAHKIISRAIINQREFYEKLFAMAQYSNYGKYVCRALLWKTENTIVVVRDKNSLYMPCKVVCLSDTFVILHNLK